jgi:hypothetical protein
MSVVSALSLALFVGFVATGIVGFLGWRQRMREGAVYIVATDTQYDLEGARS